MSRRASTGSVSQVRKWTPGAEKRFKATPRAVGGDNEGTSFSAVLLKEIDVGIKGVPACQRVMTGYGQKLWAPLSSAVWLVAGCGRRVPIVWLGLVTPRVSGSTFRRRRRRRLAGTGSRDERAIFRGLLSHRARSRPTLQLFSSLRELSASLCSGGGNLITPLL